MIDIFKKILNETLDKKRFKGAYVWFNNYVSTLDELVDEHGNTFFYKKGKNHGEVSIENEKYCWVSWKLHNKFTNYFDLDYEEFQLIVSEWVENNFRIKNVEVLSSPSESIDLP